jgi:hypothetical protein
MWPSVISKIFPGVIPPDPHSKGEGKGRRAKGGDGWEGREWEGQGGWEGKEGMEEEGGGGKD